LAIFLLIALSLVWWRQISFAEERKKLIAVFRETRRYYCRLYVSLISPFYQASQSNLWFVDRGRDLIRFIFHILSCITYIVFLIAKDILFFSLSLPLLLLSLSLFLSKYQFEVSISNFFLSLYIHICCVCVCNLCTHRHTHTHTHTHTQITRNAETIWHWKSAQFRAEKHLTN